MNQAEGVSDRDLQGLIQKGVQAHQAGQLPEAETIYRQILDVFPRRGVRRQGGPPRADRRARQHGDNRTGCVGRNPNLKRY